jgi:predicted transcriptional regulator
MDIVTLSGIRKELLLYLDDGPRSLSEIRDTFDITSPEVSPRIKELLEHNLVKFEDKKYHLTSMGKIIIYNFRPFLNVVNLFDQYPDFWNEHDLTPIPEELLKRIGEIKNFIIIEDDNININRTNIEIFNLFKNSRTVIGVSSVFEDTFPEICLNVARNNIPISIILTKDIYDIIIQNYKEQISEFVGINNAKLLVSEENIKISFLVTDDCLFLSMCFNNGKFDMHSNLVSNDISSINWGKDLFKYYLLKGVKECRI